MDLLSLVNRRVLITQSNDFMGPALARVFAALGADVIADARVPGAGNAVAAQVVADAGQIDVLIAHLALPAPATPIADVDEHEHSTTGRVSPATRRCNRAACKFASRLQNTPTREVPSRVSWAVS